MAVCKKKFNLYSLVLSFDRASILYKPREKHMNKSILSILLLIYSIGAIAQQGPLAPCVECETLTKRTEPYNGIWYNPEQSGTGISFEVQNGTLFGVYYGYDDEGKQLWLTFVGELVSSEEPNIMWTLDAGLAQFENGNSFNHEYNSPTQTDYEGQISLRFTQKNHALFSVNGGMEQNIVPIIFGVPKSKDFPEQTSYEFPELKGLWAFTYEYNLDDPISPPVEPFNFLSESTVIGNKRVVDSDNDGIDEVHYSVYLFYPYLYPEYLLWGDVTCRVTMENDEVTGPSCEFTKHYGLFGDDPSNKAYFNMKLGGLGAYRLFGEDAAGHTFEAVKISDSTGGFLNE